MQTMSPNHHVNRPDRGFPRLGVLAVVCTALQIAPVHGASPFASRVIEYSPAPGQFVQSTAFNDPAEALGAPTGGGAAQADNSSVVTLGGFGGCLVLAFGDTVQDEPLNPLGLDAIVFGNAFWTGGNPLRHWGECGVIEISADANGNGEADDAWFLIPGSHIVGDGGIERWVMNWDDDIADTRFPPSLPSWIPTGRGDLWQSEAHPLLADVFSALVIDNPSGSLEEEAIYGYADYSPTLILGDLNGDDVVDDEAVVPAQFYTVPDDPRTVGISLGSGGGDAFDIAWAIDPATGVPANLAGFDFIRICNGVHAVAPLLGEKSPEIDAVSDVAPDPRGDVDGDGDIDLSDWSVMLPCAEPSGALEMCAELDQNATGRLDGADWDWLGQRMTGPLRTKVALR